MPTYEKVITNKARCRECGDVVESVHRHDFRYCKCGAIFVDGGKEYLRRGGKSLDLIEELSETVETEYELPEYLKNNLIGGAKK